MELTEREIELIKKYKIFTNNHKVFVDICDSEDMKDIEKIKSRLVDTINNSGDKNIVMGDIIPQIRYDMNGMVQINAHYYADCSIEEIRDHIVGHIKAIIEKQLNIELYKGEKLYRLFIDDKGDECYYKLDITIDDNYHYVSHKVVKQINRTAAEIKNDEEEEIEN